MNLAFIQVLGQIDKVLSENENGGATVLFKIEPESKNLNTSIVMVEFKKKHWDKIKNSHLDLITIRLHGRYELRLKNGKPFIYVKCETIRKIKQKNIELEQQHVEANLKDKPKKKKSKKVINENFNRCWYGLISKEEFDDIDISKVKLVEEIHLKAVIPIFNLKRMREYKELSPISIRKLDDGEYGLVTGLRTFIVAKLFNRHVKAYVTDLSREEFKEKYRLEK